MAPNTYGKGQFKIRLHQILVNSGAWVVALWAPFQLYLNSRDFFNKYTLSDWIFLGGLILFALLLIRIYKGDPRKILILGLVVNTIVGFIAFFTFPITDYGNAIPADILQILSILPSRKGALEYTCIGFSALLIAGGCLELWAHNIQVNVMSSPRQMNRDIEFILSIGFGAGIYAIIILLV
ncbi:MAG TPA: hypothetical protein VKK79_20480, partial [Candidatus Lokiarchaeia archaeon]|nr:hypothetical protein [Candidatus Lokiarchaeia archaeon]